MWPFVDVTLPPAHNGRAQTDMYLSATTEADPPGLPAVLFDASTEASGVLRVVVKDTNSVVTLYAPGAWRELHGGSVK